MPERTDAELLVASRRDADAFADFYRRHAERIVRYFAARVANPDAAGDLMAETFAAAFAAAPRYQPSDGPAVAWLFTIARSKLVDAYRRGAVQHRARRRLSMEPLVLSDADLERIDELGMTSTAESLLGGLPPAEREAVRARVLDERDYDEIARELRTSPAVIRKRVSRGLGRLRQEMRGAS
jgi:RNA polymerase sigma-70 factor (ECF subfamily)